MFIMAETTVFSDFLEALGVPYTKAYSDSRYRSMPFRSLFGFSKLLQSYGIESEGVQLADKSEISRLTPPFLARTGGGFVIVTSIDGDRVGYMTEGVNESMSLDSFMQAWNGIVFLAFPDEKSVEPSLAEHRRDLFIARAKKWVLAAGAIFLYLYMFVGNGLYRHISTVLVSLLDIAGLYLTYMLVQKSLKIQNRAADRVCGVLQQGGCDSILATKASKFFGIFGWSEVGFAYFSVSLMTLLLFPRWTCYLALCNVCCLPFTFWSIWYQKFRAKIWCTLCVSVQCTLWLLFFCYLGGGWFKDIFPLRIQFFVLGAAYLTVLLSLNRLMPLIDKSES